VKGVVTSEKGEPLSGVSIAVKGSSKATTTDAQGKFEISVAENAILVFTYVGFADKEIAVNKQTFINAVLTEENAELSQVVVVGYGTQKKKDLTGSVASISVKDQEKTPVIGTAQSGPDSGPA